jgi:hypothetical protein
MNQALNIWQASLHEDSNEIKNTDQPSDMLSIYKTGTVSASVFAQCVIDLKSAFPDLPDSFYDLLERKLDVAGFNDDRLIAATDNLILNYSYLKSPRIAHITSFNKFVKVYTFDELLYQKKDASPQERKTFLERFDKVNHNGELKYALKEDIIKYDLPKWNSTKT